MAEAELVRRWLVLLRELGAWAERNSAFDLTTGRGQQRIGTPDITCCYKGRAVFIEAKKDRASWLEWMRDKSEQSPGQKRCIAEIRAAGGIALCTYLYEHVAQVVELVDNNVDSATINETIDNLQEKLLEKTNVRRQPRTIKRLS